MSTDQSTASSGPKEERVRDFSDFQSPDEASVERLIKALDRAYHRPGLMLWRSFWQGFITAIGLSAGYAVVVVVTVYIFRALGGIELIRPGMEKVRDMIIPAQLREISTESNNTPANTELEKQIRQILQNNSNQF